MTRRVLALSLVTVALLAAGAAPAAAAEAEPCAPKGARTVLMTPDVHVVARWNRFSGATAVWGCARPRGRRILLARRDCDAPDGACEYSPGEVSAAGKYVAFYETGCLPGAACRGTVNVLSLRSGRRMRADTDLLSILAPVTRRGWLAWVDTGYERKAERTVRAINADGRHVVLDTGEGIDQNSLAVSSQTAYWTHDGVARSAALP